MKLFFIGSLPYDNPERALEFVRRYSSHFPFLPQLPDANPNEDMIGQVLRGFEIGYWDELASCCLPGFLEEYGESPKLKIQIAGPYTVARIASIPFHKIVSQWLGLWGGIADRIRKKFTKELWLQIDEPFWSKKAPLPEGYGNFLTSVRSVDRGSSLGIHSCATDRPELLPEGCDFFSFDYTRAAISEMERRWWKGSTTKRSAILVAGILDRDGKKHFENVNGLGERVEWVSASCGLHDWSEQEIERVFGAHCFDIS